MKKVYIRKISNKEGKEIFKGQEYIKVRYNDKLMNLVGILDETDEDIIFCSYLTGKALAYCNGLKRGLVVNEKTDGQFLVIK